MGLQLYQKNLLEKLKESLGAVLPIIGIVLVLCFSIAPIPNSVLMTFVVGAVLLIIGMMFFTLGAEMAMTPMGERIGTKLTNTRKISVVIVLCFILGFIITISEPDLQVLAEQVPSIPNYTLIIAVATGVGIFLVAAVLRMLFGIPLAHMLLILYPIIFILASIVPQDFLTVAFDSGGVTTGPMTVPFIMALGIGFSAVRSDKHAENDSFGLVALCSVVGSEMCIRDSFTANYFIFLHFSDCIITTSQKDIGKNYYRNHLYIHRSCTFSDRGKCGIYAGR